MAALSLSCNLIRKVMTMMMKMMTRSKHDVGDDDDGDYICVTGRC